MSGARVPATFALALMTGLVIAEHVAAEQASNPQTFSGEFWKLDNNAGYMIEGCLLKDAIANKVMKFCSVGQQCEVTGIIEHCRGVRGACIEMTRLMSARWAKNLPDLCTFGGGRPCESMVVEQRISNSARHDQGKQKCNTLRSYGDRLGSYHL